jgi:hypothetical protein
VTHSATTRCGPAASRLAIHSPPMPLGGLGSLYLVRYDWSKTAGGIAVRSSTTRQRTKTFQRVAITSSPTRATTESTSEDAAQYRDATTALKSVIGKARQLLWPA